MANGGRRPGAGRPKGARNLSSTRLDLRERSEQAALMNAGLDAQAVKNQVVRGGWFDIRRLFDDRGNFRPLHELTFDEAFPIAHLELVKRNITSGAGKTDEVLK